MGLKDSISLGPLLLVGLKRACNQSSRSNFGATHRGLAKTHPLKKGTELMGHIKAASWPDRPDVFTQLCPPPFPAVIMLHAGKSCLGHYQHKARCILGDSSQAFITAREVATKAGGSEVPWWRDLGRGICRDAAVCHIKGLWSQRCWAGNIKSCQEKNSNVPSPFQHGLWSERRHLLIM